MALTVGSLFSGIGGFELGLSAVGFKTLWQVEIDPYCREVLRRHWPDVKQYSDITTFTAPCPVDVLCGGFPCQDISTAGTQEGLEGERSGLWTEYARIIRDVRPRFVIVENVSALLVRGLDTVLRDLAACGYDAEWQTVLASDFALPHRRERVFVVAYPNEELRSARLGLEPHRSSEVFRGDPSQRFSVRIQAASKFVGVDDGIPGWVYRHRAGALGNAIVPQAAEWIGRLINEKVKHDNDQNQRTERAGTSRAASNGNQHRASDQQNR